MKPTKLSYFLIFLSYLLETYLVVTLPANINDKKPIRTSSSWTYIYYYDFPFRIGLS